MTIGAEVDGEIDLGPLVLESIIGLKASFDGVAEEMRKRWKVESEYQWGVRELPIRAVGRSDTGGDTLVIDCGGPPPMRMWEVKRLTMGGVEFTTSVNGSALVVVASSTPGSAPPTTDVADEVASLPNVGYYSTRQLTLRNPNRLYVVILSPSDSTQYVVGGQTSDFPDRRLLLDTEN